jgi:very-short-patch-repair endonuclease
METQKFDLIIFDEASQIPTWDAAGVMARGKQIIIAGDPKQLPPTNFFQRQANSDEEPEDIEYQDLESVLDDFLTASVREVYLKWHYRSRNENLIAFSNHHYYDNRLLTFPSADRGKGVSLRHVGGVYDRAKSRTNPVEARAVVAEIMERLSDPMRSHQSIGVVTFNQAQQVLIEDLLDAARKGRHDLDRHFDADNPNAVMVKNLENVQGDERDVMLLSICYGPDDAGKVGFNFGPLNRNGGERRLNVAITRAKYETVAFSSLQPEQIDLSRTRALGVKHLRNYLEYARSGPAALTALVDADHIDDFDSPFEKQVAEFLRQSGFDVVSQVGCSGYRIDLGVISPDDAGQFILGIECDGKNYHSAKTARDRDRLRESVLEGLGWRLHRIWSTDWFYNRETAQRKLLNTVHDAVVGWRKIREARKTQTSAIVNSDDAGETESYVADNESTEVPIDGVSVDDKAQGDKEKALDGAESVTTEDSDPPPEGQPIAAEVKLDAISVYVPTVFAGNLKKSAPFFNKGSDVQIRYLLRKVIETESPITVDAALLRVAGFWGQNTLTSAVRERMAPAMRGLLQKRHKGKAFFWKSDKELDTYRGIRRNGKERDSRRTPNDIPPEEYANAIEWIVRDSAPLSKEGVVRLLEETLQLDMGQTGCVMLEIGIELLIAQQRVMLDSQGTFTLSEQ